MSWSEFIHAASSWGVWASVIVFFVSLFIMPIILVSLPTDYFIRETRMKRENIAIKFSFGRTAFVIAKNIFGVMLLCAGIAMLVLPGQGVLTILAGLMIMNFPGKYRLERWLVGHRTVARSINWIRKRAHKPPMRFDYPTDGEISE